MVKKLAEAVCNQKELINILFKVFIGVSIPVLIIIIGWYGKKPLANEAKLLETCEQVEKIKDDIKEHTSSIKVFNNTITKMDKKVSNQSIMLELLLQKEGIKIPEEIKDSNNHNGGVK